MTQDTPHAFGAVSLQSETANHENHENRFQRKGTKAQSRKDFNR